MQLKFKIESRGNYQDLVFAAHMFCNIDAVIVRSVMRSRDIIDNVACLHEFVDTLVFIRFCLVKYLFIINANILNVDVL